MTDEPVACVTCARGKMVLRDGKYGQFWGCSRWPACHRTMSLRHMNAVTREELGACDDWEGAYNGEYGDQFDPIL